MAHTAIVSTVNAWKCSSIRVDQADYDLSALDGDHTIQLTTKTPPTLRHTLFDINPCSPLQRKAKLGKEDQCAPGTQICRTTSVEKDGKATIIEVVAYASDISEQKSPEVSHLNSTNDQDMKGFRLSYESEKSTEGVNKASVVEFICDEDAGIGSPELKNPDQSDTITLFWKTKYACSTESSPDGDRKHPDKNNPAHRPARSSSWGFFAWLFIIVFMLIAACLIFTLFLNYNRYGQLGLDLVPTMDSVKVIVPHFWVARFWHMLIISRTFPIYSRISRIRSWIL